MSNPRDLTEREYVSAAEAQAMLGVAHATFTRLLRDGVLAWEQNPVDRRGKIIKRADVLALLARLPARTPGKEADAA